MRTTIVVREDLSYAKSLLRFTKKYFLPSLICGLVLFGTSAISYAQTSDEYIEYANNPYSPTHHHAYRHGVVPTQDVLNNMRNYQVRHGLTNRASTSTATTSAKTLSYGGGVGGVGVTSGFPKVYLVFWGSQWGTSSTNSSGNLTFSNDPVSAANYMQDLYKGLGTGGELWSGVMTQYCDGSSVSTGATSCSSTAAHVGYPSGGGVLAGVWYDNSASEPSNATATQVAQEAIKAAQHFGNTTASSNRYVQYVIFSPTGTHPDGFNTSTGQFCAWHDYSGDSGLGVTSSVGNIAFTNMPYVYDMGTSCGQDLVNSGSTGNLDGFSIVSGHEYAETLTDQFPPGGWLNGSGSSAQEDGDECAWITSGQGASANVIFGNGSYAMQSTWSNDTNECDISHVIITGGTSPTPVATSGSVTTNENTAVSGTLSATVSNGDSLGFSVVNQPAHGTVTITNTSTGVFTYTPATGYSGTDSFTFNAKDLVDNNVSNTATESVTVNAATTNTAPTAYNGSVTTTSGVTVAGTLSASDTDGDALTFKIVAVPASGSVTITNTATGAFTYTPNSGFAGSDSFTFEATDSAGNVSNVAMEGVTVSSVVNSAPTANNGSVKTTTGVSVNGVLSASDTDGDALTFSIVTAASHGTATVTNAQTGAFTYTPTSGYSGSDSFTFKATDSAGNASNIATESVTVASTTGTCPSGYASYTGSLAAGQYALEPNGSYYYGKTGYESGILSGASGTYSQLVLFEWSGYGWMAVAGTAQSGPPATINYPGYAGYYIWVIERQYGSGKFQFCLKHP